MPPTVRVEPKGGDTNVTVIVNQGEISNTSFENCIFSQIVVGAYSCESRSDIDLIGHLAGYYLSEFDPRLGEIYISPRTADRENASSKGCFSLESKVNDFLESPKRSLLLLGQPGMGKTYFSLLYCQMAWRHIRCQLDEHSKTPSSELKLPRLPLYIYLPKYDKQLHREKKQKDAGKINEGKLLETVLKEENILRKHKFSDEEIQLIKTKPLLLMLDGFDEITFRENIYQLQGWGKYGYDIQVAVTCRPAALMRENLAALFAAGGEFSGQLASYTREYLQPFTDDQIEGYFKARFKAEGEHERYYGQLMQWPSLKELVTTPFLLRMVSGILLHMDKLPKGSAGNTPRFTQSTVFDYFLEGVPDDKGERHGGWFIKEIARGRAKALLESSPKVSPEEVVCYMRGYAENLAISLLDKSGQLIERLLTAEETLQPNLVKLLHYGHPRTLFFDEKDGKPNTNFRDIRSSCLLHLYGCVDKYNWLKDGEFKFLHKSIAEYLVARKLAKELRANQNNLIDWLMTGDVNESGVKQKRGLNRVLLTKEPEIIARLAEMANESDELIDFNDWKPKQAEGDEKLSLKQLLFNILMASKGNPDLSIAAANAITILNAAVVSFSGWDLSSVNISKANLTGALTYQTNFSKANLDNVTFFQSGLMGANFTEAIMSDVKFINDVTFEPAEQPSSMVAVAHSPEVEYLVVANLVVANNEGKIYIYHTTNTTALPVQSQSHFCFKGKVKSMVFSSNGKYLALASAIENSLDPTIYVWKVAKSGEMTSLLMGQGSGYKKLITTIAVSRDGGYVATGQGDGTEKGMENDNLVQLYKLHQSNSHQLVLNQSFDKHTRNVCCVEFSPDGRWLVSGGSDGYLYLWNIEKAFIDGSGRSENGAQTKPYREFYYSGCIVYSVAFSPCGKVMVVGMGNNSMRVVEIDYSQESPEGVFRQISRELKGQHGLRVGIRHFAFDQYGKYLASCGNNGSVCLWDRASWQPSQVLYEGTSGSEVSSIAFHDCETLVLATGGKRALVHFFGIQISSSLLNVHRAEVSDIAFSPDGKHLISLDKSGWVHVRNARKGGLHQALFFKAESESAKKEIVGIVTMEDEKHILYVSDISHSFMHVWKWDPKVDKFNLAELVEIDNSLINVKRDDLALMLKPYQNGERVKDVARNKTIKFDALSEERVKEPLSTSISSDLHFLQTLLMVGIKIIVCTDGGDESVCLPEESKGRLRVAGMLSADGSFLVLSSQYDGHVRIYTRRQTKENCVVVENFGGRIKSVLSADNKFLASVGVVETKQGACEAAVNFELYIWELTREPKLIMNSSISLASVDLPEWSNLSISLSRTADSIALGTSSKLLVWKLNKQQETKTLEELMSVSLKEHLEGYSIKNPVVDGIFISLSMDGKYLAAAVNIGHRGHLYIWDVGTQQALYACLYRRVINSIKFDPNNADTCLAVGGGDRSVQLWGFLPTSVKSGEGQVPSALSSLEFTLLWSSHPASTLALQGANIQGAKGLSPLIQKLFYKCGTKGESKVLQTITDEEIANAQTKLLEMESKGLDKQFTDWYLGRLKGVGDSQSRIRQGIEEGKLDKYITAQLSKVGSGGSHDSSSLSSSNSSSGSSGLSSSLSSGGLFSGSFSHSELALATAESRQANNLPHIGARSITAISGFVTQDVGDDGNCFFYAVAEQLLKLKHSAASTWQQRSANRDLRFDQWLRELAGNPSGNWGNDENMHGLARHLNVVFAVIDTRLERRADAQHATVFDGFRCLYIDNEGDNASTTHTTDVGAGEGTQYVDYPKDRPLVRLGYTGDHFISVETNPALEAGAIREALSMADPAVRGIAGSSLQPLSNQQSHVSFVANVGELTEGSSPPPVLVVSDETMVTGSEQSISPG